MNCVRDKITYGRSACVHVAQCLNRPGHSMENNSEFVYSDRTENKILLDFIEYKLIFVMNKFNHEKEEVKKLT